MPTKITSVAKHKPTDKPYYVTDTLRKGLQLRVAVDGSKSWSYRYRIGRTMRRLTLGDAATLDLPEARRRAKEAKKLVDAGKDPAEQKQERRDADTVADFAKTYVKHIEGKLRRWKDVESRLNNDVLPLWKHKLMRDITRRDVRELIDGIAARPAPISANRVRALLHKMFNVAIQLDVVEQNPVTGTARPGVEQRRDRVLTHDEIRTFWKACETLAPEMAAAWKLRLLTAQRANEVYGMTWSELDLSGGWWTLPAERSKNRLAHRIPLSPPALKILKELRAATDARLKAMKEPKQPTFVFAGARGKRQQAEAAATFGIDDFHGHDLRRTAASLMTGSGTSRLVVSKILNHAEPGVTAVYDRHGYDAEKRVALDAWARTLTAILKKKDGANVVAFAKGSR